MHRSPNVPAAAAALALAVAAVPAPAHHGWSEYDTAAPLTLSGVIRESGYEHPHGHIRLETPGQSWLVVLAPPSRMQARGLQPEALKPGRQATVTGYPSRGKPGEMRAERIIASGKSVELR